VATSVVCVGIGGYGQSLLSVLIDMAREGGVDITGAVDPEPHRCSLLDPLLDMRVPVYEGLDAFYASHRADLAVLASPIQFHCPQTRLALSRGGSVMCEKPLAATVQDGREMMEAERAADGFVAIGYQWSFAPEIQALKADVASGLFGAPVRLRTLVLWPRDLSYYSRNSWAGRLKDAGGRWVLDSPANNATAHFLHNMLYVLGDRRETSAQPASILAETYRANDIESFDSAALRCTTSHDVEVLFYCSHATRELVGPLLHYEFERATAVMSGLDGRLRAEFADGRTRDYGTIDNGPRRKLQDCFSALETGEPVACGIEAAMAHTVCINGVHDSAPEPAPFPAATLRRRGRGADARTWVDGLDQVLMECCEAGVLPGEAGVAWARPGRLVDLTDYSRFPGGAWLSP
jgi:predicted dehydrogenase